jgi:3-hydroxybenzoate 6-monooxygenase
MMGDHIYHPAGGHAALRNTMMRAMTTEDFYDSVQWLYGGSGLAEGASAVV